MEQSCFCHRICPYFWAAFGKAPSERELAGSRQQVTLASAFCHVCWMRGGFHPRRDAHFSSMALKSSLFHISTERGLLRSNAIETREHIQVAISWPPRGLACPWSLLSGVFFKGVLYAKLFSQEKQVLFLSYYGKAPDFKCDKYMDLFFLKEIYPD